MSENTGHYVRSSILRWFGVVFFFVLGLNSSAQVTTQAVTKTGSFYLWNTTANWVSNTPPNPLNTLIDQPIVVNDYISRNGGLTFANIGANTDEIVINDTLVVYGDVFFDNNAISLRVEGLLIVFGNFRSDNKADIVNNGTMLVTGNLTLNGGQQDYNDGNGAGGNLYVGGTIGGSSADGVAGATADQEGDLSNFGEAVEEFVNGGGNSPLPVELTSFTSTTSSSGITLQWTTASELNNDYFSVERSEDGMSFYEIGRVNGNGTSDEVMNYTFIDRAPIAMVQYYRLHQVDYDGTSEIHRMIVATADRISREIAIEVFPNPTSERINLKSIRPINYQELVLIDLSGKVVVDLKTLLTQSGLTLAGNLPELESGLYYVKYLTSDAQSGIKKLFIR